MIEDEFGKRHIVPDYYDNKEIEVESTRITKTFQELTPENLLTRNSPLMNRASTRVNEKRGITLKSDGRPSFRRNGLRIGKKEKNW